jgi:putative tryptophan/tyrosine transport system substrate-binding protein
VRRRKFVFGLGGAALTWPLATQAQRPAMLVIGFLHSGSPDGYAPMVTAFRQGLQETGHIEGQNVAIEYRWAEGHYDRLPAMAADLIRHPLAVLVATGGAISGLVAKSATTTTPIVFISGTDPVKLGLVASLNRPEGNVTGVNVLTSELVIKRLELLRDLIPNAKLIAVLANPINFATPTNLQDLQAAARALGLQLLVRNASQERDIDAAFAAVVAQRASALLISPDPFFFSRRDHIVALAARDAVPAMYEWHEFAAAGGLISYGANLGDAYRLVGVYAGRILNGAKPSDLPVQQSTKVELVINLKTAKALGLTIPPTLLARADEVIE